MSEVSSRPEPEFGNVFGQRRRPAPPPPPEEIAGHEVLRDIGAGSYGTVWLARNKLTGVYRALKIVEKGQAREGRVYERELQAIRRYEPISRMYEGLVQILHVGELQNAFYYIMELADDRHSDKAIDPDRYAPRTLAEARHAPLPAGECIALGVRLAQALIGLHRNHLIHRDIKPSNIIFVNGKPRLADIGLVTQIEEANSIVGTTGFVAPEGQRSEQSDIYSFGKVLYEISTGKDRCEFPELPDNFDSSGLNLELNQILLRACDPNPQKRYRSAEDLQNDLELLQAGKSVKRLRQLEKRVRILGAAVALLVVAGSVIFEIKELRARELRTEAQRLGFILARGTDEMRKGDFAASLPLFLDAAAMDPAHLTHHRLRVGSLLASAVRTAGEWKSGPAANFSRDGQCLVAADGQKIELFESRTGRLLQSTNLDFSPQGVWVSDNKRQFLAYSGKRLAVVDWSGGAVLQKAFDTDIHDAVFHPSGAWLAVIFPEHKPLILDLRGNEVGTVPVRGELHSISFLEGGDKLAVTSYSEGYSRLWSFPQLDPLTPEFHQRWSYRGALSPDGGSYVTGAFRRIDCRNLTDSRYRSFVLENDDAVVTAAFSPNGALLATGSYNGTVQLWDGTDFRALPRNQTLYHADRIELVAFVDNDTLVSHSNKGTNYVWNLKPKVPVAEELPAYINPPDRLRIAGNGMNLRAEGNRVTGTFNAQQVDLREMGQISVLAASPNRDVFAVGLQDNQFEYRDALLFRPGDSKPWRRLHHNDGIICVQFSHRGDRVATGSEDYSAVIWDVRTGAPLTLPMKQDGQITALCFSEDDSWLVTLNGQGRCVIWDTATGDPLTTSIRVPMDVVYATFEPGERTLLLSIGDGKSYRLPLPIADLPLEKYRGALPGPEAVSRASAFQ